MSSSRQPFVHDSRRPLAAALCLLACAAAADPFNQPTVHYDTFDGWSSLQINGFYDFALTGSPIILPLPPLGGTGVSPTGEVTDTPNPVVGDVIVNQLPAGAPVPSVAATILPATYPSAQADGVAVFWGSNTSPTQRFPVVAGTLVRVRGWLTSPDDPSTTARATVRLRAGAYSNIGVGDVSLTGNIDGAPSAANSPSKIDLWLAARVPGLLDVYMDTYAFADGTSIDVALEAVDIDVTTLAALSAAGERSVLVNMGAASFPRFAGEPDPEAENWTPFPEPDINFNYADLPVATQSPRRAVLRATSPDAVSFTVSPRDPSVHNETFAELGFGSTSNGLFTALPGNSLVVVDTWIHSNPGNSDRTPTIRVVTVQSLTNALGQRGYFSASHVFRGRATSSGAGSGSPNPSAFQSTSRCYSWAFQPQYGEGAIEFPMWYDAFVFDGYMADAYSTAATATIDRVTVTRYDYLTLD